jgi:hypothetical protein
VRRADLRGLLDIAGAGQGSLPDARRGLSGVAERPRMSASDVTPRLLTEAEARAYLGGCNPASIIPPTRVGKFVRWDRFAIGRRSERPS